MGRLFNLKYAGRQADENTRDHVFFAEGTGGGWKKYMCEFGSGFAGRPYAPARRGLLRTDNNHRCTGSWATRFTHCSIRKLREIHGLVWLQTNYRKL